MVDRAQIQKVTTISLSLEFVSLVRLTLKFRHSFLTAVAYKKTEMLDLYDDEK